MKNIPGILAGATVIGLLAACYAPVTKKHTLSDAAVRAEQQEQYRAIVRTRLADQERLHRIAGPILKNGVPICERGDDVHWTSGVIIYSDNIFGKTLKSATANVLGIRDYPVAAHIIPGLPAE